MTRGERLLVVARAQLTAERLQAEATVRCERIRNQHQQCRFAVYFSQQRLLSSWALLKRHTREDTPCAKP